MIACRCVKADSGASASSFSLCLIQVSYNVVWDGFVLTFFLGSNILVPCNACLLLAYLFVCFIVCFIVLVCFIDSSLLASFIDGLSLWSFFHSLILAVYIFDTAFTNPLPIYSYAASSDATNGDAAPASVPPSLLQALGKTMNHSSNEIKTLTTSVFIYLAKNASQPLDLAFIKPVLAQLINGTKEKNSAVRASSEQALVALLRLRHGQVFLMLVCFYEYGTYE